MVLDGPINGDWFEAYVAEALMPELRPGDVVMMTLQSACESPSRQLDLFPTSRNIP